MAKGKAKGKKRDTKVKDVKVEADAKTKKGKGRKSAKKAKKEETPVETVEDTQSTVLEQDDNVQAEEQLSEKDECCQYKEDVCAKEEITAQPNSYPGLLDEPQALAVVGSECGSYESICKLLRAGLRCADRVFIMTPWGNYVVFRIGNDGDTLYFIFDGCTCNVNRFRYLDLTKGTAGLLCFMQMHKIIKYIIDSRNMREAVRNIRRSVIDDICREFCEFGNRHPLPTNGCSE